MPGWAYQSAGNGSIPHFGILPPAISEKPGLVPLILVLPVGGLFFS
jgi:hypothetical protein